MFSKIVVGLDGSEPSNNALRVACDIAGKYGSELHLVHVPQPQSVAFAMGAVAGYHTVTTMPDPAQVAEAAEKILSSGKAIASECSCDVASSVVDHGDPGDCLVEAAEKLGADLIVTGRRGLGSIGALVQGSTSLRVSHIAKCACLSVA